MDVEKFKKKTPLELSEFLIGRGIPLDVCDKVEGETKAKCKCHYPCACIDAHRKKSVSSNTSLGLHFTITV